MTRAQARVAARRAAVLLLAGGLAATWGRLNAGPDRPGFTVGRPAENLAAVMAGRGLRVHADSLQYWRIDPAGLGARYRVCFAAAELGGLDDLWLVDAQLAPTGVPLWVGAPRRQTDTPDGAETLLWAGPEGIVYRVAERELVWARARTTRVVRLAGAPASIEVALHPDQDALRVVADGVEAVWTPDRFSNSTIGAVLAPSPPGWLPAIEPTPAPAPSPLTTWPPEGWTPVWADALAQPLAWSAADGPVPLLAFDGARLAFEYVAGRAEQGGTGAWGLGVSQGAPESVRAVLGVSASEAGRIAAGQVLRPLVRGAASFAIDEGGRLALGIWDEPQGPPWPAVYQQGRPLVVDGRPVQGPSAPMMAGLGVTAAGIVVWARGPREAVADALARVGVGFAVEVAVGAAATAARFPHGLGAPAEALPGAGSAPVGAWQGRSAQGYLAVRRRPATFAAKGWAPVPRADGPAWALRRVGGSVLYQFDPVALMPTLDLQGARARVGIGEAGVPGADGRLDAAGVVRPLRSGAMTLWAAEGRAQLGRWRADRAAAWAIQGLTLVDGGAVAPGARGQSPGRAVGVGQGADGRWFVAVDRGGDRAALARALAEGGATRALLIAHGPEAEIGRGALEVGGRWIDLDPSQTEAPAPAIGPQLGFAPRALPARAAAVGSFERRPCDEGAAVGCE